MAKITLKMEESAGMPKVKTKGVDTGHISSVVPAIIKFLIAIGYDSVTDVHIVMESERSKTTWGKAGVVHSDYD